MWNESRQLLVKPVKALKSSMIFDLAQLAIAKVAKSSTNSRISFFY